MWRAGKWGRRVWTGGVCVGALGHLQPAREQLHGRACAGRAGCAKKGAPQGAPFLCAAGGSKTGNAVAAAEKLVIIQIRFCGRIYGRTPHSKYYGGRPR